MCNHADDKGNEYLSCFEAPGYEIYLCECGALINIRDAKNYHNPVCPMTADEIHCMIQDLVSEPLKDILSAASEIERATVALRDTFK
jgi:hypothetical protein